MFMWDPVGTELFFDDSISGRLYIEDIDADDIDDREYDKPIYNNNIYQTNYYYYCISFLNIILLSLIYASFSALYRSSFSSSVSGAT